MVESVEKYGGFYVGRYETSLSTEGYAQSITGKTSATSARESANTWYGLYQIQRNYSVDNTNITNSVGSSMIYGSQYDQMMIWIQSNGINLIEETPTVNGIATSKNTSRVTGSEPKDKLNNIYDLLGNSCEYTQEADKTDLRVYRGGYYSTTDTEHTYYLGSRYTKEPFENGWVKCGSRITLYIK